MSIFLQIGQVFLECGFESISESTISFILVQVSSSNLFNIYKCIIFLITTFNGWHIFVFEYSKDLFSIIVAT
jgi:hypothetical protein